MKKYLLLACCLFFLMNTAKSQVTYTVDSIPFHYETLHHPTIILAAIDDIYSGVLPLGFEFNFFGNPYDSFLVGSNGDINFNKELAGLYNAWNLDSVSIPYPFISFKNSILIPHQDILPTNAGAQIRYEVKGVAPYRKLIVDFDSISMFSCTASMFYGQAILYETTNYIDINIKQKNICSGWNKGYAILGIEDSSGTVAYSPLGRVGMTQWTAINESWRFKPSDAGPESPLTCLLKGRVYNDKNSDCISNVSEPGIMNQLIEINKTTYLYTDDQGYFEMNVDTGEYVVKAYTQPNEISSCLPFEYLVHFSSKDSTINNLNFAIVNDTCSKISTTISLIPIESCKTNRIQITCSNVGTDIKKGVDLKVSLPYNSLAYNFNPEPNFNSGAFLKYYIGTVYPGENKIFEFTESYHCENLSNEIRCYESSIEGVTGYCDTILQKSIACYFGEMLGNSPNSLEAMRAEHQELGFVKYGNYKAGERIEYKINFTNQLDTIAKNILVENIIDTSMLDMNSFVFEGATHIGNFIPSLNHFQYVMKEINLPSFSSNKIQSQGSIRYSIQIKKNIDTTKAITNRATIQFENHPTLQTNNCVLLPETKFASPIVTDYFDAYPNPISSNLFLNIHSYKQYDYAEIYNVIGQRVFKQPIRSSYEILNIEHLQEGIYSLKIYSLTGNILTKRIIKF